MRTKTPESSLKSPISTSIQCILVAFGALGLGTVSLKVLSQHSEYDLRSALEETQVTIRSRAQDKLSTPHSRDFSGHVAHDQRSASSEGASTDNLSESNQIHDSRPPVQDPARNQPIVPRNPIPTAGVNSSDASISGVSQLRRDQDTASENQPREADVNVEQLKGHLALLLSAERLEINQITAILDGMTTTITQYDAQTALMMLRDVLSVLEDSSRWVGQRNTTVQRSQLSRTLNYVVTELTRGQTLILVGQDIMAVQQRVQALESESGIVRIVNQLNAFLQVANASLQGDSPQYAEVFRQQDFVNLVPLLQQLREAQDGQFRPLSEAVLVALRALKAGTDILPPHNPLRRSLDQPGDAENPNPYRLESKISALEQLIIQ